MQIQERLQNFHAFMFEGKYFLLNISRSLLYELSEEAFQVYEKLDTECFDKSSEMFKELFNILEEFSPIDELKISSRLEKELPPQNLIWLGVTHHCNLCCKYCFVDLDETKAMSMDFDTARRGIEMLIEGSEDSNNLTIIFFGGEPLLRIHEIEQIVDYCRECERNSSKHFQFNLTTNGTLLTHQVFEHLNRLGINIMVSLDGDKDVHDSLRQMKDGKPTWDIIVRNLKSIPDFGKKIAVRVTVTAENSNYLHVFKNLEELGFERIFMTEVCPGPKKSAILREMNIQKIKENYFKLTEYLFERSQRTGDVGLSKMQRFMDALFTSQINYYGCTTGIKGYYLSPDGDFYPCSRLITPDGKYKLGDIHKGLSKEKQIELLRNHVFGKRCRNCWARFVCGGQCYGDNFWANGSINEPDSFICSLTKFKIECAAYYLSLICEQARAKGVSIPA